MSATEHDLIWTLVKSIAVAEKKMPHVNTTTIDADRAYQLSLVEQVARAVRAGGKADVHE